MLKFIAKKVFGSAAERYVKKAKPLVDRVNALESQWQALADHEFPARVAAWRQEVEQGRDLSEIMPDVFACVRDAGRRVLNMRHFDVQMIGGMVLHEGKIAEMKTGEGKTLVATLPVVLNALSGKGAHVVTVNDYLARRDAEWMGAIYNFLGLSVGVIVHGLNSEERRAAYGADITYGTNNEFGFDYLRDNMAFSLSQLVQRGHNFAIVDEVDSILIDEARTPLIISGPSEQSTGQYVIVNDLVPRLERDRDFTIDEKARSVSLTEEGVARVEDLLKIDNLFDPANITLQHHTLQALKAHNLFQRDVDYIVSEGEVVIVDEFTGRLMPGRRYSDGLHQALEAKERVAVKAENQTLASITFQNYFRMYDKLAGMTGTADTEAVEFRQIYGLDVMVIPTHRDMVRLDQPDMILRTQKEKFQAIAEEIKRLHEKGQPVLVGTVSIEKSELVSALLKKLRVPHNVLNAKNHEQEAQIVAEAGHKGKVTIATNMAGRGTDIKLGEGVVDIGGLYILGTERHESRRIDNQLRGRSGRQGDPGESRFYLALDDDLMRLFGSERISGLMERLGMKEGEAIENSFVSKAIENAQKRVEAHNFEIRKTLLEYDDVMNQQREVIYSQRRQIMTDNDLTPMIDAFVDDLLDEIYAPVIGHKEEPDEETVASIRARLEEVFDLRRFAEFQAGGLMPRDEAGALVRRIIEELRVQAPEHFHEITRYFLLDSLDRVWKEHLLNMDHLRDGIGLRGYGQKDPKQEYKREGYDLFQDMLGRIKESTMFALCHLRIKAEVKEDDFKHEEQKQVSYSGGAETAAAKAKQPQKREQPKVGRNDPCPCGSGRKHKKCCGMNA